MKLDGILPTFSRRDFAMAKLEDGPKSQPATSLTLALLRPIEKTRYNTDFDAITSRIAREEDG